MLVSVRKTRERGRKLSRIDVANVVPLVGELSLSTTHYRAGNVTVLTLQARSNPSATGRLAELFEPQLIGLGHGGMRFRGFETMDGTGYAQEWLIDVLVR